MLRPYSLASMQGWAASSTVSLSFSHLRRSILINRVVFLTAPPPPPPKKLKYVKPMQLIVEIWKLFLLLHKLLLLEVFHLFKYFLPSDKETSWLVSPYHFQYSVFSICQSHQYLSNLTQKNDTAILSRLDEETSWLSGEEAELPSKFLARLNRHSSGAFYISLHVMPSFEFLHFLGASVSLLRCGIH